MSPPDAPSSSPPSDDDASLTPGLPQGLSDDGEASDEAPASTPATVDVPSGGDPEAEAPPSISFGAELGRKALHLGALVVPLGMAWLGKPQALYVVIPTALLAVAADVLRGTWAPADRLVRRLFGGLMRASEQPGPGRIVLNGSTCVLVAAALAGLLFPLRLAVPALVLALVADAAAALVGRALGRTRWPGTARTVEGSVAFALAGVAVTAVSLAFFPALTWTVGLAGTLAAALAEVPSRPLNDNIRIPLVAAAVMRLTEALGG
jgi:dolichol kinase